MALWDRKQEAPQVHEAEPLDLALAPQRGLDENRIMQILGQLSADNASRFSAIQQKLEQYERDIREIQDVLRALTSHHKLEVEFVPGHHEVRVKEDPK